MIRGKSPWGSQSKDGSGMQPASVRTMFMVSRMVLEMIFFVALVIRAFQVNSYFKEVVFNGNTYIITENKSIAIPFFTVEPRNIEEHSHLYSIFDGMDACGDATCFNNANYTDFVNTFFVEMCNPWPVKTIPICSCIDNALSSQSFLEEVNYNPAHVDYTGYWSASVAYNQSLVRTHTKDLLNCVYSDSLWQQRFEGFKTASKLIIFWVACTLMLLIASIPMERFELSKIAMYIVIFVFAITAVALLMSKDDQNNSGGSWNKMVDVITALLLSSVFAFVGYRTFAISRSGKTEYAPLASNTQTQQEADKDNAAATQFRAICFGGFNVIMGFPVYHYLAMVYVIRDTDSKALFFNWMFYFLFVMSFRSDLSRPEREKMAKESFPISGNIFIVGFMLAVTICFNTRGFAGNSIASIVVFFPVVLIFAEFFLGWLQYHDHRVDAADAWIYYKLSIDTLMKLVLLMSIEQFS